ncbi:MAG: D-glycero-beta-D-manno-heptose-7-phosphate kinase, partial [Victivallales bacterium]|nr:D-glycero-beta-D-manno-heptose-7-phosphate kinase [Victivallales bacterium]
MMLDRYVFGRASRISQEAPVPVVHVQKRNSVPGGAANVARNLRGLLAPSVVFGVAGNDADGDELLAHLEESGTDTRHVLRLADRPTTVKTRILAGNQQVVRIDQEDFSPLPASVRRHLLREVTEALHHGELNGLILEDYA